MLQSAARDLLPESRLRICYRHRIPDRDTVDLVYNPSREGVTWRGLQTCGSVWICPICAAYISEQRRTEIRHIVDTWRGDVAMLTLTFQHSQADKLSQLVSHVTDAYRVMMSHRRMKGIKHTFGIMGAIRALESTQGAYGWHPHLHVMIVTDHALLPAELSELETVYGKEWGLMMGLRGRYASPYHGVNIRARHEVSSDYAAKLDPYLRELASDPRRETERWGLDAELTKAVVKQGHRDGQTPMQLLARYADRDDRDAGRLFQEYALAMHGRKHLVWSRGLREMLELDREPTDDDLKPPEDIQSEDVILASLTPPQWRIVRDRGLQGVIADAALQGASVLYDVLVAVGVYDVD
jgi:hypothetical protein